MWNEEEDDAGPYGDRFLQHECGAGRSMTASCTCHECSKWPTAMDLPKLLPVLTSAAKFRARRREDSWETLEPSVLQRDAAAACVAVLAHHGCDSLPVVRLMAEICVALIETHGATPSSSSVITLPYRDAAAAALQIGSPMVYLVAAARANLWDTVTPLTISVAKLVRWLAALPASLPHAGSAELAHAGAVRWLAEALYAAEGNFQPSSFKGDARQGSVSTVGSVAGAEEGSNTGTGAGSEGSVETRTSRVGAEQQVALPMVRLLVEAAYAVAGGRLHADVVETGLAGSLMRLVKLLDEHARYNSSGIADGVCSARLALRRLLAGSHDKHAPTASRAAQAVRLAVAARAHTWRRRRHAVVARATMMALDDDGHAAAALSNKFQPDSEPA